jgi:NAD(P)-dependent dehydrogenase (short-subunit alcohol dehydrogenase family)
MTGTGGRVAVVTGAARGIGQAIALRLADRGFGRIVNVASNTVWKPPGAGFVPYVASKSAVKATPRSTSRRSGGRRRSAGASNHAI